MEEYALCVDRQSVPYNAADASSSLGLDKNASTVLQPIKHNAPFAGISVFSVNNAVSAV